MQLLCLVNVFIIPIFSCVVNGTLEPRSDVMLTRGLICVPCWATTGDADILIPCEWPSWDSNTGIVDICTAGDKPDIPQALGALLGIWVLFRALEVGVWSVARAGPLHVFGLWPALVVRGLCLDRRDNPALRIPVLLVLQLNKKKCQGFPYK